MKKLLICIVLASMGLTTQAQEDSAAMPRWVVGTMTNYDIISHRYNRTPLAESYYNYERAFNFTSGVQVQYWMKKNAFLRLGFAYSRKDYSEQYSCLECATEISYPTDIKLRYIDIPFTASYALRTGKLNVYAEGGMRGSFLVQAWKTYNYGELRPPQTFITSREYKSFLLSGIVGIRSNLLLGKKFSIDLGTAFTKPFYRPSTTRELNWSEFSIQTGVNYHF